MSAAKLLNLNLNLYSSFSQSNQTSKPSQSLFILHFEINSKIMLTIHRLHCNHNRCAFKSIYRLLDTSDRKSLSTSPSQLSKAKLSEKDRLNSQIAYRHHLSEGCGAWKRLCHSANAYQSEGCEEDDEKSSILESSNLQHWFKNWQELRRNKLTASTFAGAVGFWPGRRVQLWLEKIGARKPFQGNIATSWSNIKEEEALERYKLITGNPILFPDFCVQPNRDGEEDWLGCSADGVIDRVVYDLPFHGVLEIKCPYFDGDKEKMYPWSRLPLYCIPQAQGLMEILDKDWMDFYCWTINGSSLFRLHRDPEYWELMKIALSDFWWDHVAPAKELYRQHRVEKPLIEMKVLKPAAKHELCPAIVLASKYLVDESELVMREIHGRLQEERCWDFPQLKHDQMLTEKCKHVDTRNRWFWRYEEMGG